MAKPRRNCPNRPTLTRHDPDRTPGGLARVEACIQYIESCGWKLRHRSKGYYCFRNPKAAPHIRDVFFTLKELRETYEYGW